MIDYSFQYTDDIDMVIIRQPDRDTRPVTMTSIRSIDVVERSSYHRFNDSRNPEATWAYSPDWRVEIAFGEVNDLKKYNLRAESSEAAHTLARNLTTLIGWPT